MKSIKRSFPLVLSLLFLLTIAVAANYIGPNRTSTSTTWERKHCNYVASSGGSFCNLDLYYAPTGVCPAAGLTAPWFTNSPSDCGPTWPGTCGVDIVCSINKNVDAVETCTNGQSSCTATTVTTNDPPATVSGAALCTTAGTNGWCRGGSTVSLSANEPVGGKQITYIEGSLGAGLFTVCDPADNSNVSCSWTPAEGNYTLSFWAHSTYGDTSTAQTLASKVDTVVPTVDMAVSESPNANGWYRNSPTFYVNGTDVTSGIAGEFIQVNGGAFQASPYTLLTEGVFSVRGVSTDNAGNQSNTSVSTVRIDTTAPYDYDFLPARPPDYGGQWYLSPVIVDVAGHDVLSGFDYASYLWYGDNGFTQVGNFPLAIDREGYNDLNPCAYDKAGNSLCGSKVIYLDLANPTAAPLISGVLGLNDWYVSPVALGVNAADAGSGICSRSVNVDASVWHNAPFNFSGLGPHSFVAQATDCASRVSPITSPINFKVDTVPPTLFTLIPVPDGQNGWYVNPISIGIFGDDLTSGLMLAQVQMDGGAWENGSATVGVEGIHDLAFRTQDNAGNLSTATAEVSLDLTDPAVSLADIGTSGLAGWYVSPVTVNASATDAISGVQSIRMRRDGQAWDAVNTLLLSADGIYQIDAQATDRAGRQSLAAQTVSVDQTSPTLNTLIPVPDGQNGWYVNPIVVGIFGDDQTSGMDLAQVQVDGGAWENGSATVEVEGVHDLAFRTRDHAGNLSTASAQVSLDLSDPALSVSVTGTSGSSGWYVSPVTCNATASDAVSGLQTIQARIAGQPWANQDALILSADGNYQVEFVATDKAGRQTLVPENARVDRTPPILSPTISGTMGLNNWYTSPVSLQANASDTTSGVATIQPAPAFSVTEDGPHSVNWLIQDNAGNATHSTTVFQIDQTPPALVFDPIPNILTGEITLSGLAADAMSGLATVEVSTSLGLFWQEVTIQPDGSWSMPFNTYLFPGGQVLILAQAHDLAGNVKIVNLTATIANRPPDITLSKRWYIWESGEMAIEVGDVPYERVTVEICDGQKRWPCAVLTFGPENTPGQVVWDRHFGSIVAPIGEYPVTATVTDILGRSATAHGVIVIPQPWTPTATATATPTQTATPMPTQTGTMQPTETTQSTQEIINTPMPTLVSTPEPLLNVVQAIQEKLSFGPYLVLIGFCFVLGASVSRDRRPKEWKRLAKQLNQIISLEKGEQKKND